MQVLPYLSFNGRCREAFEFYEQTLGAEVTAAVRVKESPELAAPGVLPPGSEDNILHAALRIGDTVVMASDLGTSDEPANGGPKFRGFSLSLAADSVVQAERQFAALAAGGRVQEPMRETFFSPRFGIVIDRFGVSWMVSVAA
jgi:PhnB protein